MKRVSLNGLNALSGRGNLDATRRQGINLDFGDTCETISTRFCTPSVYQVLAKATGFLTDT